VREAVVKPSALVERYRMALEVIANGPDFERATKIATLALNPLEVAQTVTAPSLRPLLAEVPIDRPWPEAGSITRTVVEDDDEPEPVDLAELDRELDEELAKDAEALKAEDPWDHPDMPGLDGLSVLAMQVLEIVREAGAITSTGLANRLGADVTVNRRKLAQRQLVERGLIVGSGTSIDRTWRPVTAEMVAEMAKTPEPEPKQDKPTMPEEKPAAEGVPAAGLKELHPVPKREPAKAPASDEGRVLDSVGFHAGWSIAQHAARLGLHVDKVAAAMRKLEREGEVKAEAKGGRVVWNVA
jgi:hypothetical protein